MEKTNELKSRLNRSFGIACLFSVVSTVITVIATVIYLIVMVIPEMVQVSNSFYDKADFYILFVLPQLLLPLLTAGISFLIPIINREKFSESIRKKRVPIHYFLLCALAFPGLSTVFSYVSYYISYVLSLIGIPVLDVSSVIPQPEGALEIFLLFFVMAVLPAICEELIYRGFLLSGISKYGKGGAILVTSIAFGLMHATIQQIPFAFFVGLILAYLAVRFDSLILPMVLHFINNFISY